MTQPIHDASHRRSFLKKIAVGLSLSTLAPSAKTWANLVPYASDEAYWAEIRKQFLVKEGWTMMNAANLCPSPRTVSEALLEATRDVDQDVSYQNRDKYDTMRQEVRKELGRYFNAPPETLALTRNTSESNNTIVQGLRLKAGDEVVVWDQNHATNLLAWQIQAQRMGFTVKVVSTPTKPESPQQLVEAFTQAFTEKTRVLGFSHISNISGVALPAQALCEAARAQGILSLVDGAQSFGLHVINLQKMDCDFYTGSTHKWLMGPREMGILYVRQEHIAALWPHVVSLHYDEKAQEDIERLTTFGQQDMAKVPAMLKTLEFHEQVGKEKVEQRVMVLATQLKEAIQSSLPQATFVTPLSPEMSSGVVIIDLPGIDTKEVFNKLYQEHRIACSTKGGLRISPNIYNTPEEVARIAEAIRQMV